MKREIKINGETKIVEGEHIMVFEMLSNGHTMRQHLVRCFYSPLIDDKDTDDKDIDMENEDGEKIWVRSIFFVQSKEEVEK